MPTTRTYCQQNHEEYLRILHHNYSQNVQQLGINVSHFAAPFPPSTFYLAPVNWIHTFSAKEKDLETGLSYFGSRYYSSDLSIWLSVDPMSDKYPSLSPYAYCANNPIKLVDPNGEEIGNYYVIQLNLAESLDTFIRPLRSVKVTLAATGESVLGERHGERSHRLAGAVGYLAYIEMVTYEQRFLK